MAVSYTHLDVYKRQVISLLFACFMCYLWTDAAKDRDNYKQYYVEDDHEAIIPKELFYRVQELSLIHI